MRYSLLSLILVPFVLALDASLIPSRIEGVAPLGLFFDATGTTSSATDPRTINRWLMSAIDLNMLMDTIVIWKRGC